MTCDLPTAIRESGCQHRFHRSWGHLRNRHVRDLAWLIDAPDLFDADAVGWHGRIARLGEATPQTDTASFLDALDREPRPLLAALDLHAHTRLGRYAESLMAFYLRSQGVLVAHGLQVRSADRQTIGEFDFLVRIGAQLVHWEFATKFYLLEAGGSGHDADYFIGPNLADTLGAKMNKIFERQLNLSSHPDAQALLAEPVARAQAFVKGWLFYRRQGMQAPTIDGLSSSHCRGFWCTQTEWREAQLASASLRHMVLPRLQWLAPARAETHDTLTHAQLQQWLGQYFDGDDMPVMVASMAADGMQMHEVERGFVVRDDWQERASRRLGLAR